MAPGVGIEPSTALWQGARESNPITYGQSVVSAPIDLPPTDFFLPGL